MALPRRNPTVTLQASMASGPEILTLRFMSPNSCQIGCFEPVPEFRRPTRQRVVGRIRRLPIRPDSEPLVTPGHVSRVEAQRAPVPVETYRPWSTDSFGG